MKSLFASILIALTTLGLVATFTAIPAKETKATTLYWVHKIQKTSTGQYFYYQYHPDVCENIDFAYTYLGYVQHTSPGMTCFPPSGTE